MSTKKFQISSAGSPPWYTFPGDTADLSNSATDIKDTVFGQDLESGQTGTVSWTMSANGYYKGFAGYVALIKKSGTSTTMTTEPCSHLSGQQYQITNPAHQVIDRTQTVNVFDNGVNQNANVASIDYLFGTVTFAIGYSVTGPVTISGNYLPMSQIASGQSFSLTQTATAIDNSSFNVLQGNNGVKTCEPGLRAVSLDLGGVFAITNAWLTTLLARNEVMVEINPDGGEKALARGIFKPMSQSQAGKVGELETESVKMTLSVPDPAQYPLIVSPFSWQFLAGCTLSTAIQLAIEAWQTDSTAYFNYLEDGTNGQTGNGVITDISLKGGLDVMNEFAIKVNGNGALTVVGTG
jgi:hypothetical protein